MTIKDTILEEMKSAMKGGDKARVSALRMAKARLQEAELALRAKKGKEAELDDDASTLVLTRHAKQLRESIEAYVQGGSPERADAERAELAVIESFLPQPLTEEELSVLVREAIAEVEATGPKQMGLVMKAVMGRTKGAADGKQVQALVRELLSP